MARNLRLWALLATCFAVATSALAQEASYQIVPLTQDVVEVKGADALGRPPAGAAARPDSASRAFDPQLPSEVEPNATSATANALTLDASGSAFIQGNIYANGDQDFFSFTAAAGDRVYAAVMTSASANTSSDSQLRLFASDGTTVIEFDDDDGSLGGLSSTIAGATIPAAGTYFLRVNHFSATNQLRPYGLYLRRVSGTPVAEVEPNDTPATATPMPASRWVSGARNPALATEQDWYSMSLNAGDTVYLSLDLDPERDNVQWNGRLGLALFGDANNQILVVDDASTGSAANPLSEAFFFTVKTAGTYYAFVDSATAATGGPTATYNMSVSVRPAPTGLTCTTYTSTNVPQTIGPGAGLVSSTITVPGNPRIADLDVEIQLNHALMGDIDAHLRSPAGNDNGLFSDIGAAATGGQTQMNVIFDDEAAIPPVFTALSPIVLKPELAYRNSWFDGEDAGGTWTLDLRDDGANVSGGTLTSWSLRICQAPPPPTCAAGFTPTTVYTTDFEAGDAGFTSSGTANEWARGLPTFAPITTCNSGSNCFKTDLANTYNASSNQNLLSPPVNLASLQPPVVVRWAQRYQMENTTFDQYTVDVQPVGVPGSAVRLFEWLDATMTDVVGNPTVTLNESAGWSQFEARADALAGQNVELRFNVTTDTTVQLAGVAVDDVSVTACRALSADLTITKTDGVATAVPGTTTTYTITASNALGGDPVPAATVTDTFPAACVGVTWTCSGAGGATCPASGSGNINASASIPAGGSVTFVAQCPIASTATGTLTNTASVSGGVVGDPNPANNTSPADNDTLTPQANLGITKTNGATTVAAGSNTIYTIVASNAGPSAAPGSTVADTFPATCTSVNWTCSGAGGGTCTAAGSGNINQSVNLPAGGSVTFLATCAVNVAAVGTLSNTATVATGAGVTDLTPGNNSATDGPDTIVNNQADLSITKTDGSPTEIPGTTVVYTMVVANAGPGVATGATVTDNFPAEVIFCSWTCAGAGGGTCGAASGNGNISQAVNLPALGSVTYTATCTILPGATGNLVNTAAVAPPAGITDPVSGNNSATDTDTLVPTIDLEVFKYDDQDTDVPGTSITYTILVGNFHGPSNAVGTTVTDILPANLTGVTWTCAAANGATCTASGTGNINDVVNLPVAGEALYTVNATIAPSATGVLSNTASAALRAGETDPDPANSTSTDTTTLTPEADLAITLTDAPDPVVAGTNLTYVATVTNNGPSDAQAVAVSLPLPPNTTLVSATPGAGGTCVATACTFAGATAPGASRSVTYVVLVAASVAEGSSISATATASSATTDPNAANNSASTTTAVIAQADLALTFTGSVTQAVINVPATFTAASLNLGPSDAQNVSVTITLTPDFRYAGHTAAGATCTTPQIGNTGAIICTWAGVTAPGVTRTLVVTAFSNTEGQTAVSASTTSNTTDPVANNNVGNLTVQVGYLIEEIPTLSGLGLLLMGLMFGLIGFAAVRRQA